MDNKTREKLIRVLCEQFQPGADVNEMLTYYISDGLTRAERIQNDILKIQKTQIALRNEFNEKMKASNNEISAIEEGCKHLVTEYQGDPSGNNDSSTQCQICQKVL